MSKDGIYVAPRMKGKYAVRKERAKRASATAPTQAEAIARARDLLPGGEIHVARVRKTGYGPDKFRKA